MKLMQCIKENRSCPKRNLMKINSRWRNVVFLMPVVLACSFCAIAVPLDAPDEKMFTQDDARNMIKASQGILAPVYAPLAEQIVADYDLADLDCGIGVDLGAGPGTLIFELCKRTNLHWVNADINPFFFSWFFAEAEKRGVGHQVSAIFADGQALPFHNNYADIIVSRGAFHFVEDQERLFSEIYRVLKPGAIAYIGRGFAREMPVAIAQAIRKKQGKKMRYDREEAARGLASVMESLGISSYRIEVPVPQEDESLSYGLWIEIRKELK